MESDSGAVLWSSHLWRNDCHLTVTNPLPSFCEWHRLWQWFKVFSVDFMRKKYFSQHDFKGDFFPPITLHVGSKLALREYCAHHSSLLMYWGVIFGSFSSVRPVTDIVHVFCFCRFERLSFDREGDMEKKEAKAQEVIGKVVISSNVQRLCKLKLIRLTFCLLFSTNWNHAWVHDVEGA